MDNEESKEEMLSAFDALIEKKLKDKGLSSEEEPTLGEIGKMVSVVKGLNESFRSPIDKKIGDVIAEKLTAQIIPGLMNPQPQKASFLDSGFMIGFGQKLGESLPTLTDVILARLGPDKANRLIDGIQNKFLGGGGGSGNTSEQSKNSQVQNTDEIILSMNPDEPANVHQYMAMRGFTDYDVARKSLVIEKEKIINKIPSGSGYSQTNIPFENSSSNVEKQIREQNELFKLIAGKLEENGKEIKFLTDKINRIESGKDNNIEKGKSQVIDVEEGGIDNDIKNDNDEKINSLGKIRLRAQKKNIGEKINDIEKGKSEVIGIEKGKSEVIGIEKGKSEVIGIEKGKSEVINIKDSKVELSEKKGNSPVFG